MEMKSMLGAITCVILIMAVVVPVISSIGTTTGDFENETSYYYSKATLANTADFTITYNSSTNGATYTSGSDTVSIAREAGLPLAWSAEDERGFRFASSGRINLTTPEGNITDVTEIKVEDGAMSYTRASQADPVAFTINYELWHITKSGDYGAFKSFKAESESTPVYSYNTLSFTLNGTSSWVRLYTNGTIESPNVVYAYDFTGGAAKTSTTTVAMDYIEGNDGILNVTGATVKVDGVQTSDSMWFIAPVEYTIEETSESSITTTLVNIIPILLIVGVVVGIVGSILMKRD